MQLSKSEKNIGAGGWRSDNFFEAAKTPGCNFPSTAEHIDKLVRLLSSAVQDCSPPGAELPTPTADLLIAYHD